jgi:hypothetical protein
MPLRSRMFCEVHAAFSFPTSSKSKIEWAKFLLFEINLNKHLYSSLLAAIFASQ